jgi:hypothetical protein
MARLRKTDGLKQRVSTLSGRAGIALTMAWLRFRRRLLYAPLYPIRLNPAAERRPEDGAGCRNSRGGAVGRRDAHRLLVPWMRQV